MIDRDRLLGYLTQHPDLALQITRIIAKRRLDLEDRLIDLLSKDVGQRLAQALLRLADDYGDDDERGTRIGLRLTPNRSRAARRLHKRDHQHGLQSFPAAPATSKREIE